MGDTEVQVVLVYYARLILLVFLSGLDLPRTILLCFATWVAPNNIVVNQIFRGLTGNKLLIPYLSKHHLPTGDRLQDSD